MKVVLSVVLALATPLALAGLQRAYVAAYPLIVGSGLSRTCYSVRWKGTDVVTTRGRNSNAALRTIALWLCSR